MIRLLLILVSCCSLLSAQSADFDSSHKTLMQTLADHPCDPAALRKLEQIGRQWLNAPSKQADDLAIWELINRCTPHNPDVLFYLGVQLSRAKRWSEAEAALKECLSLAPQYVDADVQLGFLYFRQGRLDEAKAIFGRYPENQEAREGLASASVSQMKFNESREQYQWLASRDPNSESHWAHLFDVKSHTNYALVFETNYTDAKENDPSVGAPVVKDYYFLNAVHLLIPIFDCWRLELKQTYYHQRENDIYLPVGVNYSVYTAGAQLTSSYLFKKDWKWDLYARAFEAWGQQRVNYPFHKATRFEPGTSLLYNSERQIFALDIHRESFIIKNFAVMRSQLLWTDFLTGIYGYRFDCRYHLELQAQISQIFIQGDNWENTQMGLANCQIPFIKYFTALYRFEHGHFDKLNVNYYSFMKQYMNTIGVRFHYDFWGCAYCEAIYEHRWKTTYNLYQPIGNFIYVAAKQYLFSNKVIARASYRYKDTLRFELEGHYFYETLPYRDWNINGSILWQF